MSLSDPISDMLASIRNGQQVNLAAISCPSSKMRKGVLDVLIQEGFIKDYQEVDVRKGIKRLNISLNYFQGKPVIKEIKKISKPGLRTYCPVSKLGKVRNGLGMYILSTSKGIITDHQARTDNVGGEVICSVF